MLGGREAPGPPPPGAHAAKPEGERWALEEPEPPRTRCGWATRELYNDDQRHRVPPVPRPGAPLRALSGPEPIVGVQFERTDDGIVSVFVEFIVQGAKELLPPRPLHRLFLECEEYRTTVLGAPLLGWGERAQKGGISHSYRVFRLSLGWYNENSPRIQEAVSATPGAYRYVRPLGDRVRRVQGCDFSPSLGDLDRLSPGLSVTQKYCAAQIVKGAERQVPLVLSVRPSLERNEAVLEALRVLGRPAIIVADELCVGQWMSQMIAYYNKDLLSSASRAQPSLSPDSALAARSTESAPLVASPIGKEEEQPPLLPRAKTSAKKPGRPPVVPPCLRSLAETQAFPYGAFGYRRATRKAFDVMKYVTADDSWVLPLAYSDLQEGSPFLEEFVTQLTSGFSPLAGRKYRFVLTAKELSAMASRGLVRCPEMIVVYDQPAEHWSDARARASLESARLAFRAGKLVLILSYAPVFLRSTRNAWLHELLGLTGEALDWKRYSGVDAAAMDAKEDAVSESSELNLCGSQGGSQGSGVGGSRSGSQPGTQRRVPNGATRRTPARKAGAPAFEDEYKWLLRRQEIRMDNEKLGIRGGWIEKYVVRFPAVSAGLAGGPDAPDAPDASGVTLTPDAARRASSSRVRSAFFAEAYGFVLQYVRAAGHSVAVACSDRQFARQLLDVAPGRTSDLFAVKASAEAPAYFAVKQEEYGFGSAAPVVRGSGRCDAGARASGAPVLLLLDLKGVPAELNLGWIGTMIVVPSHGVADNTADVLAAQATICHELRGEQVPPPPAAGDGMGMEAREVRAGCTIARTMRHRRRLIILSQEEDEVAEFRPRSYPQALPLRDQHTLDAITVCTPSECIAACFRRE